MTHKFTRVNPWRRWLELESKNDTDGSGSAKSRCRMDNTFFLGRVLFLMLETFILERCGERVVLGGRGWKGRGEGRDGDLCLCGVSINGTYDFNRLIYPTMTYVSH